ncbi:HAD family hydrolase [Nanoarchaeota archaeon]
MVKAIVFDIGGVYFEEGHRGTLQTVSKLCNIPYEKVHKVFHKHFVDKGYSKGEISEQECWNGIIKELKLDFNWKDLKKIVFELYIPKPGMKELVRELKKKYVIGILSDQTNWLDELDKKYKFLKDFNVVINSYEVGLVKPAKEIYQILLAELRLKHDVLPNEVVFIDNKKKNVRGAKKFGINALLFTDIEQLKRDLKKLKVKI